MTSSKSKWFRAGVTAHDEGWYISECPYARGTQHEKDWKEGWQSKEVIRGKCLVKKENTPA